MRLQRMLLNLLLAVVVAACARVPAPAKDSITLPQPSQLTGRDLALVIMPVHPDHLAVWGTFSAELGSEMDVVPWTASTSSGVADVSAVIAQHQPKVVVLMDNVALRLYRDYQRAQPAGTKFPPAVAIMASFLSEQTLKELDNTSGIAFELPALTTFARLRALVTAPIARVGVVHRTSFNAHVERERVLASQERIALVAQPVSDDPDPRELRAALKRLAQRNVDALWVLNDNVLLTPELLARGWLPTLNDTLKIPVIVGVVSLLTQQPQFGSFAMAPDLGELGIQTASLVLDIADTEYQFRPQFERALSVKTFVNLKQVPARFTLKEGARERIDQVLE